MSTVTRPADLAPLPALSAVAWQPEALARLDHGHLVAWSASSDSQIGFTASMHQFLGEQPDADIWALYGRYITDLDSLCHQLERIVPVGRLDRRVEGRHGVLSALRSRGSTNQMGFSRARYLVWNDAQTLLRADRVLFSELIDAIAGVAAEWEYAGEDMLVIQRMMLVGGPDLADYAHDPRGQFNAWLGDEQSEPFWQTVTGLERPPFEVARIEELMA